LGTDREGRGIHTRNVLSGASDAATAEGAAAQLHAQTGRTAGNGSLMRTAPVALAYLDDEDALVEAATQISELTHFDPAAGDACVLWCLAIRHAVLVGEPDVRVGLPRLDRARRAAWEERIDKAERATPADFANKGWVVEALQGASAVPTEWRAALTGWPGLAADDLVDLATAIIRSGVPDK
jgi:ADP-ribosyl-[dinitrogen reductase] hydrolase